MPVTWSMLVTTGPEDRHGRGALPWSMLVTTGPEDRHQGHGAGDDRHGPRALTWSMLVTILHGSQTVQGRLPDLTASSLVS